MIVGSPGGDSKGVSEGSASSILVGFFRVGTVSSKVVILGAGPAGLALGMKLLRRGDLNIKLTIIEQESRVGGLTASFEHEGLYFDYGSHRLHPVMPPEMLQDIRGLLGSDLLDRPRKGRIRLLRHFVKFPLNFLDFGLHLPPFFLSGIGVDAVSRLFKVESTPNASFADVLLDGLGPTACKHFYFPYARKLWGLDPQKIAGLQAQRRVSAINVTKMMRRVGAVIPGVRCQRRQRFFYPRKGFGQIGQSLAQEVRRLGGQIRLSTTVQETHWQNGRLVSVIVSPSQEAASARSESKVTSGSKEIFADFVFSTIPLTHLVDSLRPEPPIEVRNCCQHIQYRAMVLVYLILRTGQFTPYDAHYFPEAEVIFSRVSEPRNYSSTPEPHGITGLCVEIPCWFGDETWNAPQQDMGALVIRDLERVGLPVKPLLKTFFVRRLPQAYPVYDLGFERRFRVLDDYLSHIAGLVSLGRQGLCAHDNTHHTLEMAYRASECFQSNSIWSRERWRFYRKQFRKHVVED